MSAWRYQCVCLLICSPVSPQNCGDGEFMPRENGFENKRVVIVGGSSGIGLAVAEKAASQGAEVVIVSSKAERVQEAIQFIGGQARGQAIGVQKPASKKTPAPAVIICRATDPCGAASISLAMPS